MSFYELEGLQMALTQRDKEIIKFINIFGGKTFVDVLGLTFFASEQQARNRVNKLVKQGVFNYRLTGLQKPRNAITLTSETCRFVEGELGLTVRKPKIAVSTIMHGMYEQVAYYWLEQIGKVERATVYTHQTKLHHIPDLIFYIDSQMIYIEVEMQKKSLKRYSQIFSDMQKDGVAGVIYVSPSHDKSIALEKFLPQWDRLRFIDLRSMIENIKTKNKIGARSHGLF